MFYGGQKKFRGAQLHPLLGWMREKRCVECREGDFLPDFLYFGKICKRKIESISGLPVILASDLPAWQIQFPQKLNVH